MVARCCRRCGAGGTEMRLEQRDERRHGAACVDAAVVLEVNDCEYQWEYRLVSATRIQLRLVAAPICHSCSEFQLFATRRNHSARTFNPKVAGSIPARPTSMPKSGPVRGPW